MPRRKPDSPFKRFNSSPEVIRLVVLMYIRFPLSLRNVEDLLFERGIDICHETVRFWWNRFGPMFAADIRRQRVSRMRGFRQWKWHLDEVYVKINGEILTKTDIEQLQVSALKASNPNVTAADLANDEALRKMLDEVTPRVIVNAIDVDGSKWQRERHCFCVGRCDGYTDALIASLGPE